MTNERTTMSPDFATLIHDNEQDRANCISWWKDSTQADKLAVFDVITMDYLDKPMEIMSRFAQLAFLEMVEKHGM